MVEHESEMTLDDELSEKEDGEVNTESLSIVTQSVKTSNQDYKFGESVGLADVMAKILRSTKPKKNSTKAIILSRAKKDQEYKDKETDADDIGDSTIKRVKVKHVDNELENLHRTKPDAAMDMQLEKQLTKIATKGVVQLFNAVSNQQNVMKMKKETKHSKEKTTVM